MHANVPLFILQLTVLQGDIAKVKCDAVIHPTNASCSLAGLVGNYLIHQIINIQVCLFFVGRALRATGGAKLEKECTTVASQTNMSVTEGKPPCNNCPNRSPYRIQCNSSSNRSPYRIQCNNSSNRSPYRILGLCDNGRTYISIMHYNIISITILS